MNDKKKLNAWLEVLLSQPHESTELSFPKRLEATKRLALTSLPSFVIVVSGTNGKGSVITLLEKLFVSSNINVGAITSPHLIHFNERIRINEQPVADKMITDAFSEIHKKTNDLTLDYFAYAMLAGLLILKKQSLDVVIVEVGFGGRLDLSNLIENDLTVITNVDLDHCEFLGDTREKIAKEKAALIKENTLVVCGDRDIPQAIVSAAIEKNAKLQSLNQDYFFKEAKNSWDWKNNNMLLGKLPKPNMILQNAATALQVFQLFCQHNEKSIAWLDMTNSTHRHPHVDGAYAEMTMLESKHFHSSIECIKEALKTVYIPGRLDLKQDRCLLLLDVAHNPQSVKNLMEYAKPLAEKANKVFAICGINKNKNIEACINMMMPLIDEWHIAPTGSSGNQSFIPLKTQLLRLGISQYSCYPDVLKAYQTVRERVFESDLVIVFGSFMIVGPVLQKSLS